MKAAKGEHHLHFTEQEVKVKSKDPTPHTSVVTELKHVYVFQNLCCYQ